MLLIFQARLFIAWFFADIPCYDTRRYCEDPKIHSTITDDTSACHALCQTYDNCYFINYDVITEECDLLENCLAPVSWI